MSFSMSKSGEILCGSIVAICQPIMCQIIVLSDVEFEPKLWILCVRVVDTVLTRSSVS